MQEHGQVGQVVADGTHLIGLQSRIGQDTPQGGQFVAFTLNHQVDSGFLCPTPDGFRSAPGQDRHPLARLPPKLDPGTVADVEGFEFVSLCRIDQGPIRQDAVHVEEQ